MSDADEPKPLPRFVDATDVARMMKCSRSSAYEWLREAAGRERGTGRRLCIPLEQWLAWWEKRCAGPPATVQPGLHLPAARTVPDGVPLIRLTPARRWKKPRP